MRPFPEIFDPTALIGVRGRQFRRREDAFQQLVGDGLRELRQGLGVHVYPTRGTDGSIDIFIEPSARGDDRCLPELPKPLIVECKDHEEGSGLRKNLLGEWGKLAKRLGEQAARGWPGDYEHWRSARAYVYAVSARLSKDNFRKRLHEKIVAFFAELPGRPPLERIVVLDWSELRALFDGAPRLADRWLGVGLEALLGHADQIERFTGFRSYLVEAKLPFLAPPKDDPVHPDALLARLSEPERERGLLLEGPGGVGKSRTLVEVAVRADAMGWRVLHAQPSEPALANEDLEATVLAGSGPTLLVLDYLDQMQLDLMRLRQRLLPAAAVRGIRLALLANARPGGEGQSAGREDLFDIVPIRPTIKRAREIADRLLATVAPRSLERLGHDRLAKICGLRPIIALFIAREIERREAAGTLTEEQLAGVRSGDLTRWLRGRLAESGLAVPPPPSRLEPASPSPHLVAAAAILAAAPQAEAALAAAGEHALRTAGLDPRVDPSERSRRLIVVLREMGWLEVRDGELAAAHDVVADEVVHDVLTDRSAALVRTTELEALLAPARGSARTLGRLAVALRRVLGMEGIAESVAAGLARMSASWLVREATGLGQLLPHANVVEVSYALGAVIHGKPWEEAAFSEWDALVAPFLTAHAERPATRHLLYRGLSKLPEGHGNLLFPVALRWLGRNYRLLEASFVLGPLLDRKDFEPGEEARIAITQGLAWLKSFGDRVEAQFVLTSLLSRADLKLEEVRNAVSRSLNWLESFGDRVEANYLLNSLLSRANLEPEEERSAVSQSLKWLGSFGDRVEARFLLNRLLSRTDLKPEEAQEVPLFAAHWVRVHPLEADASFMLKRLLSRNNLTPKVAQAVVDSGVVWFETNAAHSQADFVFSRLLRRQELEGERRLRVTRLGIEWLRQVPFREDRDFVLGSLLWNAGLLDECDRQFLAHDTLDWLALEPRNEETVMRLETALRRVAGKHSEESWVANLKISGRSTAPEFFFITEELVQQAQDHENVPEVTWLSSVIQQADLQLQGESPVLAGYALPCLLPLAARIAEQEIGERVRGLAERFLSEPTLTPKNRFGFASACYRYLDEGAWPDREAGERLLAGLGIERPEFLQLTRELAERLRGPVSVPTEDWLKNAIDQTELILEVELSVLAGYALSCLLPLAARIAEQEIGERVRGLAERFLSEPTLTPKNRFGFASACYRYLDESAWPDREAGERLLAGLGIERPELLQLTRELDERLHDSSSVLTEGWLRSAIDQTERALEGDYPASAGYALASLLPLVARSGTEALLIHVSSLAKRFLREEAVADKSRYGFVFACRRLAEEGCWPDREVAERVLGSFGIESPLAPSGAGLGVADLRTLEKEAVRLATSAGPLPNPDWLDLALAETAKPIERGFPKHSGFLFPALLPLAARLGSARTREVLGRQIRALLADPSFSANGRMKFSQACYRFVDEGAWPDREEAERILISFGIERFAN